MYSQLGFSSKIELLVSDEEDQSKAKNYTTNLIF